MEKETNPLVISGLPLANLGVGQGVYTYRIIMGLLRRAPQLRFRVLVPAHFATPPEVPEEVIVRVAGRSPTRHPFISMIYWSNRILAYAAGLPRETVFHSPGPIAGFHRHPKTVVTIHDCLYRTFPKYLGRLAIRRLNILASERFAARSALVFTQSEFSARDIAEQTSIPAEKIRVLSPWAGDSFSLNGDRSAVTELRQRLKLPERFWLYVGGYDYRKNIEFLLASYAEAKRQRRVPPLLLAGLIPQKRDPVLCDVLGAISVNGLGPEDVLTPGFISVEEMPILYRAASLLIYPSLMEGFGLPPAEAMAAGTPVLASNCSSLPEVVRKPECLFDPTDGESLSAKLVAAASDEAQFLAALSPTFTEEYGIRRYLQLIDEGSK